MARKRMTELESQRQEIEKRLDKYPDGKIHIVNNKGSVQYYLRNSSKEKSGKYIPKRETRKIRGFLQKKYDGEVYRLISLEMYSLERLLKKADSIDKKIQEAYSNYPQVVKEYIYPIDISDEDFVREWLEIPYTPKEISPNSVFNTDKGESVRSKSELNIANTLYKLGIPYRYEKPFRLDNGLVIHPDFTLLDIKNRREIYWEHRGMMDDPNYVAGSVKRIKILNRNGVVFGDNLIITEETKDSALGTDEIRRVAINFCNRANLVR